MDNRKKIINNIINITFENKEIKIVSLDLNYSLNKYSAKKNEIWHIVLNDKNITKKDKYIIKYKCLTCSTIHSVGTTQFIRKINKCSLNCYLCRNTNEEKRKNYSEFMKLNNSKNKIINHEDISKNTDPKYLQDQSIKLFETYDNDFKENYFGYHLTNEDYLRISKNIISFHNNNLNDIKNYEYWSIFKTNNQMNFTSIMYDKINNTIFKAHQPIINCDKCKLNWRAKSIERFKNCLQILCKDCSFVSNTFKIKTYYNCDNNQLLYQSPLELKFIKWCNENKYPVKNGPNIIYYFEEKKRIYKIDFQINNILIEIKDNNIWHKKDLESGKWHVKEVAVINFINESTDYNYFYLINPSNWIKNLNTIKIKLASK